MKAFLEEYGFVILIAIVIILLIVMATPVGNSIKASILGLVDRFSGTATSKLDKADQGDFTANLRQAASAGAAVQLDLNSDSTTDKYTYTLTYVAGGKTHTTSVNGGSGIANGTVTVAVTGLDCGVHAGESGLDVDDGAKIYVTVTNVGTNEVVQSNTIKFHK